MPWRPGMRVHLHRAPGSDGVRRAYVSVYKKIAYRRKLCVGRASFHCVFMEDNEIDKPLSSCRQGAYQARALSRRAWLARGGSVKIIS